MSMSISGINPLSSSIVDLLADEKITVSDNETAGGISSEFSDILTESLKTAEAADSADKVSGLELLTGQSDDMSGLLLDAQKAELSLNLALQIRNKVIDAYNEIMRIQV